MQESGNSTEWHGLRSALRESVGLAVAVFVFSALVNFLIFTGPLYMMQVYDRVLATRSVETLAALSLIGAFLFVVLAIFDGARSLILFRIGARLQYRMDPFVLRAALFRLERNPDDPAASNAEKDMEALQRLLTSPAMLAACDLLWAPLFLATLFVFHPLLGWLASFGGVALIVLAALTERLTRRALAEAGPCAARAERQLLQMRADPGTLRALGLAGTVARNWRKLRLSALSLRMTAMDRAGIAGAATRGFRLFLQSAGLGVGAWLVLRDELGTGALFAASVLTGRALAPIEIAIPQWAVISRAREAWRRLDGLMLAVPPVAPGFSLPRPNAVLEVERLRVTPPGATQPTLEINHLRLEPGQVLGVIGPSGAGKSAFARALTGVWPTDAGAIRLGGMDLSRQTDQTRAEWVGYMPQKGLLIEGTVAANIARFAPEPDTAAIIAATRNAGAHEMILRLPDGYDTWIGHGAAPLSGGQAQRIALARALFGSPLLLVLDEPHAHLDHSGTESLAHALRQVKLAGGIAVVTAHRPVAIELCDLLLVLEDSRVRDFGPRDRVLRSLLQPAGTFVPLSAAAGGRNG